MDNREENKAVATNDSPKAATALKKKVDLHFKYLPAFAQFILGNNLEEFALKTFRLSQQLNLPALKLFKSFSEEQLLQLTTRTVEKTLKMLAANKARECIEESLNVWKNNELPFAPRNAIVAEDITLQSFIRRKAFRDFLQFYTSELEVCNRIMEEIDVFVLESETAYLDLVLESQQSLYKQAQSLAHIGNWLWDLQNNNLIWSEELYRIYELEPGSAITNESIAAYNHPEDKDYVMEQMRVSGETRRPHDFYYRIILKDGKEKTLHAKGEVNVDRHNNIFQFFGTLQDVTEQKKIEKELQEQQTFIQKIAHVTPSLIAAYNVQSGKYIFINNALKKLLGYDPHIALANGTDFFVNIIHPDDLPVIMDKNAQALARANQTDHIKDSDVIVEFQYRLRNAEGEYRWFHTYGTVFSRDSKNQVEHVLNISVDVTEQYLLGEQLKNEKDVAESRSEELRRSEERYQHMIAEVDDYAILLLNKDGIVQNWNKGAEKINGYVADEIVGKSFTVFYPKEDIENKKPEKLLLQATETGKATDEGWRVRKDGTTFWAAVTITALHDKNNNVTGFTKLTRDLTERKNAEDKLYEYAKKLEQKNEELIRSNKELESFNYVASHDLQEPLRKIQVFSNAILSSEINNLSERAKDYFARMNGAANRMRRLIEDLLAFSRTTVSNATFEDCDLNEILDEVLSTLKFTIEETNAAIESEKLPVACIIPFQFKQLLQNLISNSIKYRKPGTVPRIKIQVEKVREKISDRKSKDNYIKLTLSDNGIGFEQQHADKIFELFQRLHSKDEYMGTGIGLAICKKIVQNHNGFIKAKGQPGVGATFEIFLPSEKKI